MNEQMITDPMGNSIIQPSLEEQMRVEEKSKKISKQNKRANDYNVAIQAVEKWGKPLAFHAGECWSFTPDRGWEVSTTDLLALCNKLRGNNTEKSVFKILCNQLATPSMEHVQEASTYLKRVGGIWEGHWEPFKVTHEEVVFADGVLNLRTLQFLKLTESIIFGPRVTIPFPGLNVECSEFKEMIEFALPDAAERDYFQKVCSLILQPHVLLRGQIIFWGVPHSGKTTLANALACAPAGLVGSSFTSESRLVADKFASTPLINKFANVSNDSDFTPKWEAFMKEYTSGTMTVEPKFHKSVSLPVTATLISTCNEMQRLKDLSGAAEMRFRVFEFKKPIEVSGSTNQTEKMVPSYWCNPERRKGIVSWLLMGLRKALSEGINEPESIQKAKKKAIAEMDPLYDWVSESFAIEQGDFITSKDILERLPVEELGNIDARLVIPTIERVWGIKKTRYKGQRGFKNLKMI